MSVDCSESAAVQRFRESLGPLECGHTATKTTGLGTGYGRDASGARHCYDCCTKQDLARIEAGEVVTHYTNRDLTQVTNWPGHKLMRIVHVNDSRAARKTYVRAVDNQGRLWWGVGPRDNGNYITLRLMKNQ